MRILLVKMSSLGDVFHTFPALTDALAVFPDLKVDWIVEEAFSEIPAWHPAVEQIFPIRLREWRKSPISSRHEIKSFFEQVNINQYDLVIDAQGLLKSVWVVKKIHAQSVGMDWFSAREALASLFYDRKISVDKNMHAIDRLRVLFAKALGYEPPTVPVSYDLDTAYWSQVDLVCDQEYLVFLHGTTWDTKLWPVQNWVEAALQVVDQGKVLVLPWGTQEEKERALQIRHKVEESLPESKDKVLVPKTKLSLNEMARLLKFSKGIIAVDTGLSHVAAALEVPMVVLYRVTDPEKIGAKGKAVIHLVSPEAKNYVKSFKSTEQEQVSLEGLDVQSVLKALNGLVGDGKL